MAEIHEIRKRMSAVTQTRKITNAMYLISSTRMKRAAKRVGYNRDYFSRIRATIKDILSKSKDIEHPYLDERGNGRAAFLIIAGDKGLCGSYNSAVLKFAENLLKEHDVHYIETVGLMATDFFKKHGREPDAEIFLASQNPSLHLTRLIVQNLFRLYDTNLIDEVYIVYTAFINTAVQYPSCVRLLPLTLEDFADVVPEYNYNADMLYEPSPKEVFNNLVPQYAVGLIYGALTQSHTSEHCARMNAMQSSTKNADEMLETLTREFHTERQLAITNEMVEVTAGASSVSSQRKRKST